MSMPMVSRKHLFLSHASADKETIVRPFAARLDELGISYWLDEAEIGWGDRIGKKINEGLATSDYVLVFLSKSFVGRNWAESELSSALTRENSEGKTVLLPIVIGAASEVLASYPLLHDKKYLQWHDGIDQILAKLQSLVFSTDRRNIGLVVNAYGKVSLVYDLPFHAVPSCVAYHTDTRRLEILLEDGTHYPIEWKATTDFNTRLSQIKKMLFIRMQDNNPVEGYETPVMQLGEGQHMPPDIIDNSTKSNSIRDKIGERADLGPKLGKTPRLNWVEKQAWVEISVETWPSIQAALAATDPNISSMIRSQFISIPLTFYPNTILVRCKGDGPLHEAEMATQHAFYLVAPSRPAIALGRTNQSIYFANEALGVSLTNETAADYLRFFFHFVHGRLGSFQLAESSSDIPWRESATLNEVAELEKYIHPIQLVDPLGLPPAVELTATVLFKDALFQVGIRVALEPCTVNDSDLDADIDLVPGQIQMYGEQLIYEDLTVERGE